MNPSKTALRELKELYRRIVGDDLTDVELLECAICIARLIQIVIKRAQGK